MTNIEFPYRIKKKFPLLALYTVIGILMLIISLVFLFSSFIPFFNNALSAQMLKAYMILGGICTPFFAFTACFSILNITSPTDAIIITKKGFHERTMADGEVGFVPAEAIISLKLFGNKNKKFLGIRIEQEHLDNIGRSKKSKKEIFNNVESGMPAIIIRECDISVTVRELLDIMLKTYSPENKKTLPQNSAPEIVGIPDSIEEEDVATDVLSESSKDAEVLSLPAQQSEEKTEALPSYNAADDLPLTIEDDQDRPHITNVDELLSHILKIDANGKDAQNEK